MKYGGCIDNQKQIPSWLVLVPNIKLQGKLLCKLAFLSKGDQHIINMCKLAIPLSSLVPDLSELEQVEESELAERHGQYLKSATMF